MADPKAETSKQAVISTPSVPKKTGKEKRKERKFKTEPSNVLLNEESLPDSVVAFDYMTARAKEFSSMLHAVQNKSGAKRIFQKLPKHMRRRAMSFNVRRLPRKLRGVASQELESSKGRPTRKKRRLPSSYNKEYLSRQKDKAWLETHLWHAKRMKMDTLYGYKIPVESYSKGVRVNYRFMNKGALLTDISYYSCLEVIGTQSCILKKMSGLFTEESVFHSPDVLNGSKEGVAIIYSQSPLLWQPIGPVCLLWQPNTIEGITKLWVWCLPVILQQVKDAINLSEGVCQTKPTVIDVSDQLLRFRLVGPLSLNVLTSILVPPPAQENGNESSEGLTYLHNSSKWVELSKTSSARGWWVELMSDDLITQLNELYQNIVESGNNYLIGTAISTVTPDPRLYLPEKRCDLGCPSLAEHKNEKKLKDLLKLLEEENEVDDEKDNKNESEDMEENRKEEKEFEREGEEMEETMSQENEIEKEGKQESHQSLLQYKEPHLHLSQPRPLPTCTSFLWDADICNLVSSSKLPDHIINEIRGQYFLRTEKINFQNETSLIPVTIIKRSYPETRPLVATPTKCKPHLHSTTGWDLIIPCNWGMSFWMSLIYRGTRPCSHNDIIKCCNVECPAPVFPQDFPDTVAGQQDEANTILEFSARYDRYPPDKRQNFGKLRISNPFSCNWAQLVTTPPCNQDTNPSKKTKLTSTTLFFVLRDPSSINTLRQFQSNFLTTPTLDSTLDVDQLLSNHTRCLVTVICQIATRGAISCHSTLSLPTLEDLTFYKNDKLYKGPLEPLAPRGLTFCEKGVVYCGEYNMTRKEMKDVKRKRKKVLSCTNSTKLTDEEKVILKLPPNQLYHLIPSPLTRPVIGYIGRTVGYRHASSHYTGIGHISLNWWVELCKVCRQAEIGGVVCLCRGHTQQYQLVDMSLYEWIV